MLNRILICLDDLEHTKAIASYSAQVIQPNNTHITLFHCIQSADLDLGAPELELNENDKAAIDTVLEEYYSGKGITGDFYCREVFNSAKELLKSNGFNENQISEKLVIKDIDIAACILQEAYNYGYTTIIIAKRREIKLPITSLGSVTERVVANAIGKTVWIVSIATSPWFRML